MPRELRSPTRALPDRPGERPPRASHFRRLTENLIPQTSARRKGKENMRPRFERAVQTSPRRLPSAATVPGFKVWNCFRGILTPARSPFAAEREQAFANSHFPPTGLVKIIEQNHQGLSVNKANASKLEEHKRTSVCAF